MENTLNLFSKRAFTRVNPDRGVAQRRVLSAGQTWLPEPVDTVKYNEVTQADFMRELDPESHAINSRDIYKTFWQKDDDGLFYEVDFPRYAFPFQREILDDRHARLTGNDMHFALAEDRETDMNRKTYDTFRAGWSDKNMERAWHFLAKSCLATGDGAFVGILSEGKFCWRVFSYLTGDTLYPHYDRLTGQLKVFARTYTEADDLGVTHTYADVWDEKYIYHLVKDTMNGEEAPLIAGYRCEGYRLDGKPQLHGFKGIPVAYHRDDFGPCWSPVQELIEHYEAAFSRLAQSNHEFGLPILGLYGDGQDIKQIATADMSYASKVFMIPTNGKAEFLNRQDASPAYKTEIEELRRKIYEGAAVVKAPELKSGDTPAAAIKLLYSDSYNKALLETQEYDECVDRMVEIFEWGFGIEKECRLDFANTRIVHYLIPFIPQNDSEITTNLSMAVQNKYCSKRTASENFYFSTPNEYSRLQQEIHDDDAHTLLLEEQRIEIQNEGAIELAEETAKIQTEQQEEIIDAQAKAAKESSQEEEEENKARKVNSRKRSVNTGRGRGRPRTVNTDENGNRWGMENNWDKWNQTH